MPRTLDIAEEAMNVGKFSTFPTESLTPCIETEKNSSATMVQKVYVTYNQVSFPSPPGATA